MTNFDIENSVGFLLAKAHQRLFASFRKALTPYGLTPPQFALLGFLWKQDGLSQIEISEKSEVDRTTIGGLVDRLENCGLVERRRHPDDRRAYLVHLTEAGRALEAELTPVALRAREKFTAALEPGDYEKLCEMLKKLRG